MNPLLGEEEGPQQIRVTETCDYSNYLHSKLNQPLEHFKAEEIENLLPRTR